MVSYQLGPYLEAGAWTGAMEPKCLVPASPSPGLFADSRSGATEAPEKWQLALGTAWASAFSRAPGERVGWTQYCLACDSGRLPRLWAKGREVSGRKQWKGKVAKDREGRRV